MSIKTERLGNMLHREISNILMTEVKDKDFVKAIEKAGYKVVL